MSTIKDTTTGGPLSGVRVIELANYVSGPFAAMMLADLGAEVIKIETPKGDPFRRFGRGPHPVSAIFVNSNHGKQSVVLDLKRSGDQSHAHSLLADADVMLTNWRPEVAPRLGLDDEVLKSVNPRLVRVYVTGFGASGPMAHVPTYDAIVQAHLGAVRHEDDEAPPAIAGSYVVDKIAASMVAQATVAALFERERSGVGTRIDVSLLSVAAYFNFPDLMANRTFIDDSATPAVNTHAAATRAIRAADGWIVVMPVTGKQIRNAFEVVGLADFADELLQERDATTLTTRMFDALEKETRTGRAADLVERFAAADVPAGRCLTIDQHLDDAQIRHNDTYPVAGWAGLGEVRWVRYPATFGGSTALPREPTAPPGVGDDTDTWITRPTQE